MKSLALLSMLIGAALLAGAGQGPPPPAPGQPVTPARDQARPPAPEKGTAIIRGVVLSADDGSPVRRAEVRASSLVGGRGYDGYSDAEGQFELTELPAGRYLLAASKQGYLSPGIVGSTVPRNVRVEVADRQVVEKVQLLLSKGAIITGRILDDLGDPAVNVSVQALRFAYRDGVRQLMPASGNSYGPQRTDDLGQFRLFGLVPGEYYISAKPGNLGLMRPQPLEQGAATTFYPGTQDVAAARRVRAVAGRETGPIAFALGTTRLARVRGHAFGVSGLPLKGTISIVHREPFGGGGSSTGGSLRPDGSFEFNSVSPGVYVVTASDVDSYNATPAEQGSIRITVAGQDLEGLTIFAAREAILRGRVVTDDGSPLPAAFTRARVDVESVDPAEAGLGQTTAAVREDGTFEIKGLFGRRRIVLGRLLDWYTRETRVNGEDVSDTGFEFGSGQVIEDADIVVTRKVTMLSGNVTDRSGAPVPRATIVLFHEDERMWMPRSRYLRTSMSGEKGIFQLSGAPPSERYLAVAVTDIEDGQWADREFLQAVKEFGTRVRLGDGEKKTVDLKVLERR